MVHLELSPTEAEILRMVLESYLSDLRMEIADTDSLDYRKGLKDRKAVLRKIADLQKTTISTVNARYRYGIEKLRSLLNSDPTHRLASGSVGAGVKR